jgi:hypothetical protein
MGKYFLLQRSSYFKNLNDAFLATASLFQTSPISLLILKKVSYYLLLKENNLEGSLKC